LRANIPDCPPTRLGNDEILECNVRYDGCFVPPAAGIRLDVDAPPRARHLDIAERDVADAVNIRVWGDTANRRTKAGQDQVLKEHIAGAGSEVASTVGWLDGDGVVVIQNLTVVHPYIFAANIHSIRVEILDLQGEVSNPRLGGGSKRLQALLFFTVCAHCDIADLTAQKQKI
jgi:hypothetical protein